MKLYAISDLHLANKSNRDALHSILPHNEDWLILAGDTGETVEHLKLALAILTPKFRQIIWVPGNHDLWTIPLNNDGLKGEYKYKSLVNICRTYNVITPEDEYPQIKLKDKYYVIAPTFTLYDYSYRPDSVNYENAVDWAAESGVVCTDEDLLIPSPHNSIKEWCHIRCKYTELKLDKIPSSIPIIFVNHYPIIEKFAILPRFPRFTLWCGTKYTQNWLKKYNIKNVVYGHTHIRLSIYWEDIKFDEVSLGYPRDWNEDKGIEYYLREIVPPNNGISTNVLEI